MAGLAIEEPIAQNCPQDVGGFTIFLSIGIVTGLVLIFIPQGVKIIIRKSIEGVSIYSFTLGMFSSLFITLGDTIHMWSKFRCCSEINRLKCFVFLSSLIQLVLCCINYYYITVLIYIYSAKHPLHKRALLFLCIETCTIIFTSLLTFSVILFLSATSVTALILENVWNTIGLIVVLFQWSPQILATYKLKGTGSLSRLTVFMDFIGTLTIFTFQVLNRQSAFVCISYILCTLQHFTILSLSFYFDYTRYRARKKHVKLSTIVSKECLPDDDVCQPCIT